jgi:hypothetical protein
MPPREGPRLEKVKHQQAEDRLRHSILEGRDYPGKDEDVALIQRKARELGPERLRRVVGGG